MSESKIIGYAAMSRGQSLQPFLYDPPELGEQDIRVAVSHCGLCHTDIQAIDDFYEITDYPFVPGHEIVGTITAMGNAVTSMKIGDRVGIGWQGRSCGHCEWCLKGEEPLCMDIESTATWLPYGGFSSSVMVDHRFAYPIPEAMSSETASVLMCAGITVYNPLKKYASEPGLKLAILGMGGLGHLAIQFAHALGYDVTVFSSSPGKREEALAFGANHFIVSSDRPEYLKHTFYFDLVLCTATGNLPWNVLLNIPKKRGTIILVSFPDMVMNPTDLVAHELTITTSFLGNRVAMSEMLAFASGNHISPVVEIMPMAEVNAAIQKVRENKAHYRIVLVNEPT